MRGRPFVNVVELAPRVSPKEVSTIEDDAELVQSGTKILRGGGGCNKDSQPERIRLWVRFRGRREAHPEADGGVHPANLVPSAESRDRPHESSKGTPNHCRQRSEHLWMS